MRDMKKGLRTEGENYAKTLLCIQRKRNLPTYTISRSRLLTGIKSRDNGVARGIRTSTLNPIVLGKADTIE